MADYFGRVDLVAALLQEPGEAEYLEQILEANVVRNRRSRNSFRGSHYSEDLQALRTIPF